MERGNTILKTPICCMGQRTNEIVKPRCLTGAPGASQDDMMKELAQSSGPPPVSPGRVRRVTKRKDGARLKVKGKGSKAAQELASLR